MKKLSIFLMGALAMAFAACEDAPVQAPVQANPQEPIMQGADVTCTAEGFVTESTNPFVIAADAAEDDYIDFIKINSIKDAPAGAVLGVKLQVADNADYIGALTLDGVQTAANTYAVSAAKLADAHNRMFGNNPATKTVYYRVPAYLNIDGVDYRLGGTDYYIAEGNYLESYNPGYVIEDVYYVVINGTEHALKGSDDIYANPTFSNIFDLKAGDKVSFKAPNGTIWGPEDEDDTNPVGTLLEGCTNTLMVENGGTYIVKFTYSPNPDELCSYSVSLWVAGEAQDLYIKGEMNEWSANPLWQFVTAVTPREYICYSVEIPAGQKFKIADADWKVENWGGVINELNTPTELDYSGADMSLPEDFFGDVIISISDGKAIVTFKTAEATTPGEAAGVYVRGGMNGWGAEAAWEFKTTNYAGLYVLEGVTIEAGKEFKFASSDWNTVDLGYEDGKTPTIGGTTPLWHSGANIKLDADFTGNVKLVVLANGNGRVTFTPAPVDL